MTSRTAEDRKKSEELYATGHRPDRPPSSWVVDTLRRLANALGVAPGVLLRKARLSPAKPGRPRKRKVRAR